MQTIKTIVTVLLLISSTTGWSQHYIQMTDLTGFGYSASEITLLETASTTLVNALPEAYRDSFKVYDFGFYPLNVYIEGRYQEVFDDMKFKIESQSKYYLIFGRMVNNKDVGLWVDFAIPDVENFPCIDQDILQSMLRQVQYKGTKVEDPFDFCTTEIEIINFLKEKFACREICDNGIDDDGDGWIDCNDPDCYLRNGGQRRSTECAGQAVFREFPDQKFGFDDNKIKPYPTYHTPLGKGIPWKSLGVGVEDQVNIEISDQLVLVDLEYVATGVVIIGNNNPRDYAETITIRGDVKTQDAKIEVRHKDGSVIGGLMIKVLEPKSMILNLVLMKLPEDPDYPELNFQKSQLEDALNSCFKQVNVDWTVNPIDKYEYDFDMNDNNIMDTYLEEDRNCMIYLSQNFVSLYINRYYPYEQPQLMDRTATILLYQSLQNRDELTGELYFLNGNMSYEGPPHIYGAVSTSFQYSMRTVAHELGHRMGWNDVFLEFEGTYTPNEDIFTLMDYNYESGWKIRAYQW
ncbi:MAG TPA: hypothetical protein DCX89_00020 [Saprospirales bacterium]|nr:hypothetical protein [Saprospirales bacterium]HAY70251.1 hypothetical protein [Saprospirales bacterium]HRQ30530.1 hypothetical protein [Saprospiraceae bacterium]